MLTVNLILRVLLRMQFKLAMRRLTLLSSLQAWVSRTPGRHCPPGDIGRGPPRLLGDCRELIVVAAVATIMPVNSVDVVQCLFILFSLFSFSRGFIGYGQPELHMRRYSESVFSGRSTHNYFESNK